MCPAEYCAFEIMFQILFLWTTGREFQVMIMNECMTSRLTRLLLVDILDKALRRWTWKVVKKSFTNSWNRESCPWEWWAHIPLERVSDLKPESIACLNSSQLSVFIFKTSLYGSMGKNLFSLSSSNPFLFDNTVLSHFTRAVSLPKRE